MDDSYLYSTVIDFYHLPVDSVLQARFRNADNIRTT